MLPNLLSIISQWKDAKLIRFKDRESAAITLVSVLRDHVKKFAKSDTKILVLGIPRGGVIIASKVADKLDCKFDFIVPGRLVAPNNKELTIGAIMDEQECIYLIPSVIEELKIDDQYIDQEVDKKINEIREKTTKYLLARKQSLHATSLGTCLQDELANEDNHLVKYSGKFDIIVLLDDGVYSGASVIVAVRWILKNLSARRLIVGSTVIPNEVIHRIKKETANNVDVISLISPPIEKFRTVGVFYHNFEPVSDDIVVDVLKSR